MQTDQFRVTFETEMRHWWFVARREILRALLAEVVPPSAEAVLVDVGCATGGNLALLSKDYTCVGIELSPDALALAQSRPCGARFICGAAPDDLGEWARRARLFLVADVLEHVEDDAGLLRGLVECALPGAYLLLTVPADPSQWGLHDVSHGHRRRYDRAALEALWQGLPVEPLLVSYYNARLYPLVKCARWWNRLRGRSYGEAGTDLKIPPAPVNRLLRRVLRGELRVLRDVLHGRRRQGYARGVSLIALLRKAPSAPDPAVRRAGSCVPVASPGEPEKALPVLGAPVRLDAGPGSPASPPPVIV